jgi:hypothetical protein
MTKQLHLSEFLELQGNLLKLKLQTFSLADIGILIPTGSGTTPDVNVVFSGCANCFDDAFTVK